MCEVILLSVGFFFLEIVEEVFEFCQCHAVT